VTAILVCMLSDTGPLSLVIIFVSLAISITLHEAMHAFAGYWLGDDTAHSQGRISLNPLRHVDPFATVLLPLITLVLFHVPLLAAKPVPFNPYRIRYGEYGAALVALAGPFTNLLLAIAGAGILHLTQGSIALNALLIFVQINVGLFVFNMIPLPPLDGSRLLYAFAPEGLQNLMAQIEQFGFFLIFGLLLIVPGFSDLLISLNSAVLNVLF
jgi:Zn-dependent protease